jgi:hypothetical protein
LTGWKLHPARATAWSVEYGMILGRGPNRDRLYTASDDYTNFHARIEAKINGEGNACFCFRVPSIINGQLTGSGHEVTIDAAGSKWKTGSIVDLGKDGQSKMALALANEWFVLEVIALGRQIIVKVNGRITVAPYDTIRRNNRGHLALRQVGAKTEVRFRTIEVRTLDLGNDPTAIAAGAQPRPLVAQAFKGKQYMAFGEVISWNEARSICRRIGGRLALPVDAEENRFLTTLAQNNRIEGVWLGASDQNVAGQWLSVDRSELQYDNWEDGQPELADALSQQHYPLLLVSRDGKWSYQPNISREYRPGYICQWD